MLIRYPSLRTSNEFPRSKNPRVWKIHWHKFLVYPNVVRCPRIYNMKKNCDFKSLFEFSYSKSIGCLKFHNWDNLTPKYHFLKKSSSTEVISSGTHSTLLNGIFFCDLSVEISEKHPWWSVKKRKKDSLISENLTTTSPNLHFSGVIGPLCTVVEVNEERCAKIFIWVNPRTDRRCALVCTKAF